MQTSHRVPDAVATSIREISQTTLTTRYYILPSLIALVTGFTLASTAITSIALTYAWQTKWRKLYRLPFISEAHYDDMQSPIFSTMTAATAFCSLVTVIATYIVTRRRGYEYGLPEYQLAADNLGINDEERVVSLGASISPVCLSPGTEVRCAKSALVCGCTSALLLLIAGAISAKLSIHMIFARSSFVSTSFWSLFVNLSLRSRTEQNYLSQKAHRAAMWACTIVQFSCVLSIISIVDQTTSLIVIVEYITVTASTIYVFLLSFLLARSKIRMQCDS